VTSQTGSFTFPSAGTWYDYLNGNTITTTGSAQSITLQPGEFHVYLNRNLTNVVITPVSGITGPGNQLLLNVYPNPVQPASILEIDVPQSGKVQAELLNSLGQKITTIFTGSLSKGKHNLSLADKTGYLPGGSYLIKVQANTKTSIIKIAIQ
jgi:1,4-alpha-glucan branching enzyme